MKLKESDYVKTPTPAVYIRYKGVWDMQDLYLSMVDFFRKRKYKFHEKIYKHKSPSPYGVERQYIWSAEKREDQYMFFNIDIYFHTYDAHDVQVKMKDGTSKTMTKGRIWMEFKGHMAFDWEKRWENTPFFKKLRNFYNKYVIKKRMEQIWWDQLYYREIHQRHALVKQKLKMESEGFEHRYWTGVHS
jgi:hypothetical protein